MPRTAALPCAPVYALHAFGTASWAVLALLAACCACAQASAAAAAETVWRCQTAEGNTVAYQSTPCQDEGRALPTTKPPSPTNHADSVRVAEREARLARALGRQRAHREKLEKDLPPAHTSLSGPVRQVSVGQRDETRGKVHGRVRHPAPVGTTQRVQQRRRDVFRAEVPGRPRKRAGQAQAEDAISASASPSR